jgi:hypothetical protein
MTEHSLLDTARTVLAAYLPEPGAPEPTIIGVPFSELSRDELVAVIGYQAARHEAERRRLIDERQSWLGRGRKRPGKAFFLRYYLGNAC